MSTSNFSVLATLKVGTKLKVETTLDELLVGRLLYFHKDYEKLQLNEVIDLKRNIKFHLPQLLDINDIIRIYKCVEEQNQSTESEEVKLKQQQTAPPQQHPGTTLNAAHTTEKLLPFTLITQRDAVYCEAINDIQAQPAVYVIVEPSFYGRNQQIAVISIATDTMVHIFDMMSLGELLKEMRDILSANYPKKVMHYSHRIKDQLKFTQKLQLSGIFDTFVAYSQLRGVKESATLTETIEQVLHIPLHNYNFYSKPDTPESVRHFRARPLSPAQLLYLRQLTIYQKQLYKYLVEQLMLKEFKQQCEAAALRSDFDVVLEKEQPHEAVEKQSTVTGAKEKLKDSIVAEKAAPDAATRLSDAAKETATDDSSLEQPTKQKSKRAITLEKLKLLSIAVSKAKEQAAEREAPQRDYLLEWLKNAKMD